MAIQKTFDQILATNPTVDAVEEPGMFKPHEAIDTRMVFEPMPEQGHVRITARSESYDLLWGVIASPGMLTRHPVEVAFYEHLIDQAKMHLPPQSERTGTGYVSHVLKCVADLRKCLDAIEKSLKPKKPSDKTEKRASAIVPDVNDALRLLNAWNSTDDEQ